MFQDVPNCKWTRRHGKLLDVKAVKPRIPVQGLALNTADAFQLTTRSPTNKDQLNTPPSPAPLSPGEAHKFETKNLIGKETVPSRDFLSLKLLLRVCSSRARARNPSALEAPVWLRPPQDLSEICPLKGSLEPRALPARPLLESTPLRPSQPSGL